MNVVLGNERNRVGSDELIAKAAPRAIPMWQKEENERLAGK
jgi:hypothetical protein